MRRREQGCRAAARDVVMKGLIVDTSNGSTCVQLFLWLTMALVGPSAASSQSVGSADRIRTALGGS